MATLDPTPPAGDLKSDLDKFTTLEACVTDRATLDPLVGDAIRAIGYETFLRDACRVLEAAKTRDQKKCTQIDASGLRTRCEVVVAVVMKNANMCPWEVSTKGERQRDATCAAMANRSTKDCATAEGTRARHCEAVAGGNDKPCEKILLEGDRALCKREVERWRALLVAKDDGKNPLPTPLPTPSHS